MTTQDNANIIDFESPVTVTAPEATEAAADDEVTDFERAATVAAPQKQRLTKTQEVNLEFLTERVSEMMGGLDYLTTITLNNEGAGYTGTLIAEELRAAIESLRKARQLAWNVIDEHYGLIVE